MTTLLVPREQVNTMLVERIRAGEELSTQAKIAEKAGGHRDWNYLFSTWRDHSIAELAAVYDGAEVPYEFEFATITTKRTSPRDIFPHARTGLDDGLRKLRDLVERLPLARA